MFNIEQYPSVLLHFKSLSKIFKKNSSGWYELFCPYCDDATRKLNPTHGHFNLSPEAPFGHCFRCSIGVSLVKVLLDTGFKDQAIINELSKYGNITYNGSKKVNVKNINIADNINKNKLIDETIRFSQQHYNDYLIYLDYVKQRCFEINPIDFYLTPNYLFNYLTVQIRNYSYEIMTNRFINHKDPTKRYFIPSTKPLYYFQNISNILDYNNIVICEGAFDLINLYNYSPYFDNSNTFYIAIGGSNYKAAISSIVSNFLLIGDYNINIVFDSNVDNKEFISNNIKHYIGFLNPSINFNFFIPSMFKDVSDLCMLERLND